MPLSPPPPSRTLLLQSTNPRAALVSPSLRIFRNITAAFPLPRFRRMKKCFALEDVEEAKWNSTYQDTYFCDKLSLEVRGGARLTAHQGEGDLWGGGVLLQFLQYSAAGKKKAVELKSREFQDIPSAVPRRLPASS